MTPPLQVFFNQYKSYMESVRAMYNEQGTQWEPRGRVWSYSSKEQSRKVSTMERPLRTILQPDKGRSKCKDLAAL